MLNHAQLHAYLDRLGLSPEAIGAPGHRQLAQLQHAHLHTVPFENLSIHLDEAIVLDPDLLVAKIVERRRGGFCYEANGAFATLLEALGYSVTRLEARTWDDDGLGVPFDHLTLRVDLDEPYLVDVGFGASFTQPLRLDVHEEQLDPGGSFMIRPEPGESDCFDLVKDGEDQYRVWSTPRTLQDFEPGCTYHQTSVESPFTRNTIATILGDDGRHTIRYRTLYHQPALGTRTQRDIVDDDELRAAYHDVFGIRLERLPPR